MSLENKKRKMLLRDFQSGYTVNQVSERLAAKYDGKGYGIRTCQRWFSKFRSGDLSLDERPSSGYIKQKEKMNGSKKAKEKRATKKEVRVESVSFKHDPKKQETRIQGPHLKNETIEKLIQRKSEITVTKVNNSEVARKESAKPSIAMKRVLESKNKIGAAAIKRQSDGKRQSDVAKAKKKKQASNVIPPTMPKLRPVNGLEADLQLPPHIAKRMTIPSSSTESHSIGDGRKSSQKSGETVKKSITVQFQNVSPDLAKNTVRKTPETVNPPLNSAKRPTVPQSTALSLPKGVIYLNPQEIFKQSFGYPTAVQRPPPSAVFPKSIGNVVKTPLPIPQPVTPAKVAQPSVVVSDSDSEDDIVFPQDVSVPQPKVKAVAETFTTYWDMETDRPILLNPTEDPMPPILPLIEID